MAHFGEQGPKIDLASEIKSKGKFHDPITDPTKNLEMLRVRTKVEITSMSKMDRRNQTKKCFDDFKSEYLNSHPNVKTIVMYPPTKRMHAPVQFADSHYISYHLNQLGKEVWFLSHNQDGSRNWWQPLEWRLSETMSEQYPTICKISDVTKTGPNKIDTVICPTWLYDRNNKTRLGGGRGNWKKLVESQNPKPDTICLYFNVQAQAYFDNFRNELMIMDYAFEGEAVFIPPSEADKNNPTYDPSTGRCTAELPMEYRDDPMLPNFDQIPGMFRDNPNFGGQGHFSGQ